MKQKVSQCGVMLVTLIMLSGCAVKEAAKKVIGNSTQTLQARRAEGVSKTFFCGYQDCYEAVMALGRRRESVKPWIHNDEPDNGLFDIFMSDLYANPPYIIVMGVEGSVDTTEVGVFFERVTHETIRIDISSLSSGAQRSAAEIIFKHLEKNFKSEE